MSISGVSSWNYVPPSTTISGAQNTQVSSASDSDGDGDGSVRKSQGHGQLQGALLQALQSLGLTPTQPTSASTPASSATATTSAGTDSDGDNDGSGSKTGGVKNDVRQFLHALFQAIKGESTAGSSTTSASSTDPKANFAAGLSALITQASNGTAPTDLQNAFSTLATDLQANSPAAASATSGSTDAASQKQLLQLLTQFQQNLGYGGTSSNAALGNLLNVTQG
jgi:hypothetical protein